MINPTDRRLPEYALSVRQPWAWLIAQGYKDIENRPWRTKYRGEIAIHAGKTFDQKGLIWVQERLQLVYPTTWQMGGIVGVTEIVDCVRTSDSMWFMGEHGFVLANSRPVNFIPCKGKLGFFRPYIER